MHYVLQPFIAFLVLGFVMVGSAPAAPAPKRDASAFKKDAEACHGPNDDHEARIAACTRVIESRQPPPRRAHDVYDRPSERLAEIFQSRAMALMSKGDYEACIRDFNEAIRLSPTRVDFRRRRSVVHSLTGDKANELRDYEEILRLISETNSDFSWYRERRDRLKQELERGQIAATPVIPANPVTPAPPVSGAGAAKADAQPIIPATKPQHPSEASAPVVAAPPVASLPAPTQPKIAIPVVKERRVALVIGNSAYTHAGRLENPANDAADMASVLRALGFEVIEGRDLDFQGMRGKVREFSRKLDGVDVGLFFYAGHGVQVAGRNYLVPVDATLESAGDLGTDAIDLAIVLAPMEGEKRVNIVLLDACRNNPFTRSLRRALGSTRSASVGAGLAPVRSAAGTLIAFATDPDNVAEDGQGKRNSPFTMAMLKHVQTKGLEVEAMMKRVRQDVIASTKGKQTPWSNSSLVGDVFLAQ